MTEVRTSRTRRTWVEKLMLWPRAYQTKIWDRHREAVGRGPTPQAAQEAAERQWLLNASTKSAETTPAPRAEAEFRGKATRESNSWPKRSTDGRA